MNLSALPINVHSPAAVSGKSKWITRPNEKWKKLQAPEGVYPVRKNMSQYTQKKDNMRVIALNKNIYVHFLK